MALDVRRQKWGEVPGLSLAGEMDIAEASRVEAQLKQIEESKPSTLLLDLRDLTFMDSTGLRVVLGADRRARDEQRRLAIVRGPDAIQRLFTITRLDTRLDFVDDPSSFQGDGAPVR
jgi:anti-anti-sigma factor